MHDDPAAATLARARQDGVTCPTGLIQVFVYGSLCAGQGNHRLLRHAAYCGTAQTAETYRMWHIGFPILCAGDARDGWATPLPAARVLGEVYAVDVATLARLDALEGEGRLYHRRVTRLAGPPAGGPHATPSTLAYAYHWAGKPDGEPVPPRLGTPAVLHWPSWVHDED